MKKKTVKEIKKEERKVATITNRKKVSLEESLKGIKVIIFQKNLSGIIQFEVK